MFVTEFDRLPQRMQNSAVKEYAEILSRKKAALFFKRLLDILVCGLAFLITLPLFLMIALLIKCTSKGPVFFRQERIGKNLFPFRIFKFRTMVQDADARGVQLTSGDDSRITGFGKALRKTNLDEMPQFLNVIKGDMSIIGTRPEVKRYVDLYTDEMLATLLLPPGMLSDASVKYKDENDLLTGVLNPQEVYQNKILPDKMKYNLNYLKHLSIGNDMRIIGDSIRCVFEHKEKGESK